MTSNEHNLSLLKAQPLALVSAIEKLAHKAPRTFIVGGYVRDLLLGGQPKDADVEVYGVDAKNLKAIVEGLFGPVDVIGESFGILKVNLDDGYEIDISIPRKESKSGQGHKGFLIEGDPNLSIEDALRRRDFTVNAIALDPLTGEIVDPFRGVDDLQKKMLRVVNEKTFQEDPLRVFRAVQFSARLEFSIDEKSLRLMKEMVVRGDLGQLSKERVTDEWKKLLLRSSLPSIGFNLMRGLGIIERYYPEVHALIGTPQEPEWHPEGDVWIHTLMVIDEAAKIVRAVSERVDRDVDPYSALSIMLASLCHDFGKPLTTKQVGDKLRSLGHEEAGVAPARAFLKKFTFGAEVEKIVSAVTLDHLKPSIYYRQFQKGTLNQEQYVNATRKLLKRLRGTPLEVFLAVTEADIRGRGKEPYRGPYEEGDFMRKIIRQHNLEDVAKELLLTGRELIDLFGLKEGPELGRIIAEVEKARDDGRISTKEEAMAFVKETL